MIKLNKKIWIRLILWVSVFAVFFFTINYFKPPKISFIHAAFNTLMIASMYFLTRHFLFPMFYRRGKKYFIVSAIVIFALSYLFLLIDVHFIPRLRDVDPTHETPPMIFMIFRFLMTLGFTYFVATSISLMGQTMKLLEREKSLSKEKLETELKLLKAQINPHFIFNALNNIYSMTYMKSEKAPESVLKLSDMLRYVFYDCSKDKVQLSAEIKYIENFTAFQQMKSDNMQNIKLSVDPDLGHLEIAPMLFIPFIENGFKYSRIEEEENAWVNISIRKNDDNLIFVMENSVPETNKPANGSGMGIENVKSRLGIIYPEMHNLTIEEKEGQFRIELSIRVNGDE